MKFMQHPPDNQTKFLQGIFRVSSHYSVLVDAPDGDSVLCLSVLLNKQGHRRRAVCVAKHATLAAALASVPEEQGGQKAILANFIASVERKRLQEAGDLTGVNEGAAPAASPCASASPNASPQRLSTSGQAIGLEQDNKAVGAWEAAAAAAAEQLAPWDPDSTHELPPGMFEAASQAARSSYLQNTVTNHGTAHPLRRPPAAASALSSLRASASAGVGAASPDAAAEPLGCSASSSTRSLGQVMLDLASTPPGSPAATGALSPNIRAMRQAAAAAAAGIGATGAGATPPRKPSRWSSAVPAGAGAVGGPSPLSSPSCCSIVNSLGSLDLQKGSTGSTSSPAGAKRLKVSAGQPGGASISFTAARRALNLLANATPAPAFSQPPPRASSAAAAAAAASSSFIQQDKDTSPLGPQGTFYNSSNTGARTWTSTGDFTGLTALSAQRLAPTPPATSGVQQLPTANWLSTTSFNPCVDSCPVACEAGKIHATASGQQHVLQKSGHCWQGSGQPSKPRPGDDTSSDSDMDTDDCAWTPSQAHHGQQPVPDLLALLKTANTPLGCFEKMFGRPASQQVVLGCVGEAAGNVPAPAPQQPQHHHQHQQGGHGPEELQRQHPAPGAALQQPDRAAAAAAAPRPAPAPASSSLGMLGAGQGAGQWPVERLGGRWGAESTSEPEVQQERTESTQHQPLVPALPQPPGLQLEDKEMFQSFADSIAGARVLSQQQYKQADILVSSMDARAAALTKHAAKAQQLVQEAAGLAQAVSQQAAAAQAAGIEARHLRASVGRGLDLVHATARGYEQLVVAWNKREGVLSKLAEGATPPRQPTSPDHLPWSPELTSSLPIFTEQQRGLLMSVASLGTPAISASQLDMRDPRSTEAFAKTAIQKVLHMARQGSCTVVGLRLVSMDGTTAGSSSSSSDAFELQLSNAEGSSCGQGGFAAVHRCCVSEQGDEGGSSSSRVSAVKVPVAVDLVNSSTVAVPSATRTLLNEHGMLRRVAGQHAVSVGAAGSIWLPVEPGTLSEQQRQLAKQKLQAEVRTARFLLENSGRTQGEAQELVPDVSITRGSTWYAAIAFMEMQACEGDLGQVIRCRLLAPLEQLVAIGQVAEAVCSVHASGVLHRDVKPSNCLVVAGPQQAQGAQDWRCRSLCTSQLVLADFDVAAPHGFSTQTSGTRSFRAPEQGAGQAQDERADTYSCGSTGLDIFFGYEAARELRTPLQPQPAGTHMRAPRSKAHDAAGVEELLKKGHLSNLSAEVQQEVLEFLRGTLAYLPGQRWSVGQLMSCCLVARARRAMQRLQDPALRDSMLQQCLVDMKALNPDKEMSL